jgi:hypothetical protein
MPRQLARSQKAIFCVHDSPHPLGVVMGVDAKASVIRLDCQMHNYQGCTWWMARSYRLIQGQSSLTITALAEYAMSQIPRRKALGRLIAGKTLDTERVEMFTAVIIPEKGCA